MKIGPVFRLGQVTAVAVECSVIFKKEGELVRFQQHEAPITLLSASEEFWITGSEDKVVYVLTLDWEAKEVRTVRRIVNNKKVVGGAVADGTLLFGDKHGDVWKVDLHNLSSTPVFAMGHQAMLEGLWLGRDLLTFDKEHKIKVSGFPDTYTLRQVLLGHSHNIISAIQYNSCCYSSDGSGHVIKWNDHMIGASANLNGPLVLFPQASCIVAVTCEQIFLLDPEDLSILREVVTEHEGVVRILGRELCTISTTGQDIELHSLVID